MIAATLTSCRNVDVLEGVQPLLTIPYGDRDLEGARGLRRKWTGSGSDEEESSRRGIG